MNFKKAFLSGLPWLFKKIDFSIWASIGYAAIVIAIVWVFGN